MVRDPAYRAAKYKAKMDPDAVRLRIVAQKDAMGEQVALVQESIVQVENKVKDILDNATTAIAPCMYPPYLSFGKELFGISRKFSGKAKTLEGSVAFNKWKARGLTASILKTIGDQLGFDTSGWQTGG